MDVCDVNGSGDAGGRRYSVRADEASRLSPRTVNRMPTSSGTWQGAVDISAAGGSSQPQFAFDSHGNGVAVWTHYNGTNTFTQAAGLDAAGPLLNDLSIPPTGVAGAPVFLSVSPLDVWSPLAGTSWSFGDGQTATGATVSHTYTKPGSYTVGVSSGDTLNNTTKTTASIAIAPAPVTTTAPPTTTTISPTTTSTLTTKPPGAPTLTWVSETRKRWREANRDAVSARTTERRPPVGTNFSFTLNEAARLTFVFMQTEESHRVGRKCQAQSHAARHPRCWRTLARGTLTYAANTGRHHLSFQGRLVTGQLPLGGRSHFRFRTRAAAASPTLDCLPGE